MFSYRLTMGAIGPHKEVRTVTACGYMSAANAAIAGFKVYAQEMKTLGYACEVATLDVLDSADPSFCDTYEIRY